MGYFNSFEAKHRGAWKKADLNQLKKALQEWKEDPERRAINAL